MNRKLLALALVCSALALGACGDDEEEGASSEPAPTTEAAPPAETTTEEEAAPGGGSSELKADADPGGQLAFTVNQLEGKAGKITITMENPSPLPHAIGIMGDGVDEQGETVEKDGTSKVTAELKPGEYEFYCPVPGHTEGGMKGTLTVK